MVIYAIYVVVQSNSITVSEVAVTEVVVVDESSSSLLRSSVDDVNDDSPSVVHD